MDRLLTRTFSHLYTCIPIVYTAYCQGSLSGGIYSCETKCQGVCPNDASSYGWGKSSHDSFSSSLYDPNRLMRSPPSTSFIYIQPRPAAKAHLDRLRSLFNVNFSFPWSLLFDNNIDAWANILVNQFKNTRVVMQVREPDTKVGRVGR